MNAHTSTRSRRSTPKRSSGNTARKKRSPKPPVPPPSDPRGLALRTLNKVERSRQPLDVIIENMLSQSPGLDRRDRSLLYAIVYGVLRWRARLDWVISRFSRTPLARIEPPVLNLLRMGLFQVLFLDRIPNSAAVNTSVQLAKSITSARVVGFVNGVLRNVIRKADQLAPPSPDQDPVAALAVGKSFPRWLVRRWVERYDAPHTAALCDAMNSIPPITIRANTLKTSRQDLMPRLETFVSDMRISTVAPSAIHFQSPTLPIDQMPAFKEGGFQVQDEAAQLVSLLLNPRPGETIIDACCGLGGKTGHLAALMENRGEIYALDNAAAKLERLEREMDRLGATIVKPFAADLTSPHAISELPQADRILLDAPCSGLGVIRRNPDAKWRASKKNLGRFHDRQVALLNHLVTKLKPGGAIVYAVCTMEPEENEKVIIRFLKNRKDFAIEINPALLPEVTRPFITKEGFFRTLPHTHGMDGFFSTVLKHLG